MYPSRHFRFVRGYQSIVHLIQNSGTKCRSLADGRSGCVHRTDRNGSTASVGSGTDPAGQGRTPPDAGQRPGRGRPGRLPASCSTRRSRTGSRARVGRCSPVIGRTATTTRVRQRSGPSDTKERWRAKRLRKAPRGVMANRSGRDVPDPNPITHEAQLGAAAFPGARAWRGHALVDFTSLAVRQVAPAVPWRGGPATPALPG